MKGFQHIPMDWRYREVPEWARQSPEGDNALQYFAWLACHLRYGDFPMNEAQQRYADSLFDKTPVEIAIDLADSLGYIVLERDCLEEYSRQGIPFSAPDPRGRG